MWPSVNDVPSTYDNGNSIWSRNDVMTLVIERFDTMTCLSGSMTSVDIIPLNVCLPRDNGEFIKFQAYFDQNKFDSQLFASKWDCDANMKKSGVDPVWQYADWSNPLSCSPSHLNPSEGNRVRIVNALPAIPPGFIAEV